MKPSYNCDVQQNTHPKESIMAEFKYLLQRSQILEKLGSKESCQMEKWIFQAKFNNQSVEKTTLMIIYIPYH